MKSAISDLNNYYESLGPTLEAPPPRILEPCAFPFIRGYGSKEFKYLAQKTIIQGTVQRLSAPSGRKVHVMQKLTAF